MIEPESNDNLAEAAPRTSATLSTPVGPVTVTATAEVITRVEWRSGAGAADSSSAAESSSPILAEALAQLRAYFDGELHDFNLPLSLDGVSEVSRSVLGTLASSVAYGTTKTYGELADINGRGVPARAIGGIMGANPLPLFIPCHRIVSSDGLGGYSGGERGKGLETKRWLLEFEGGLQQGLF